ncbi:UNVERIFIED_CONTAM: hypothetical protein Sradi_2015500 [Sesamum radiatum]|uniref:Reverse transcriptase n=1 Tax=Sesamum radiatum TaxID=300843 RepID=A0AAW2THG6_SESRA
MFQHIRGKFDMFGIEVAPRGRSGGLMLRWDKAQVVHIRSYSSEFIGADVYEAGEVGKWRCQVELLRWEHLDFESVNRCNKEIEKVIEAKQQGLLDEATNMEVQILKRRLEECRSQEEILWQQRTKAHWLYDRDRNTKLFHASANIRRRQNTITKIKDAGGRWCENTKGIQQILLEYFHGIFTSTSPLHHELDSVLNTVRPKVTEAMNESLLQPFTEQDVRDALFGMSPLKSPGPDDNMLVAFEINHYVKNRTREVFSYMLQDDERRGVIQSIAVTRQGLQVSHLLFVDNTIIIGQAQEATLMAIKQILTA